MPDYTVWPSTEVVGFPARIKESGPHRACEAVDCEERAAHRAYSRWPYPWMYYFCKKHAALAVLMGEKVEIICVVEPEERDFRLP